MTLSLANSLELLWNSPICNTWLWSRSHL